MIRWQELLEEEFAFEIVDEVSKHLAGKHDQSTHGHDAGRTGISTNHLTAETATEAQKNAIDDYTGFGFDAINGYARGKYTANQAYKLGLEDAEGTIATLDGIIDSSPRTTEEMTLYRGVSGPIGQVLINLDLREEFKHKGYVSTSNNLQTAKSFADGPEYAVLHIRVPAGTKAFDLGKYRGTPDSEGEIIFARNTKMVITDIAEQNHIVWVDLVNE